LTVSGDRQRSGRCPSAFRQGPTEAPRPGVASEPAPSFGARSLAGPPSVRTESLVLDVVYVLGVIVLFAVVGLVAKAVEKL
jgi:hypothetical protein